MQSKKDTVKSILKSNKKVMENYFFMTVLQVLNSLFYIIIYPYLIRTLGADSYGLYVFAFSIVTYFTTLISFGFDLPGVKAIAENIDNKTAKERVLSNIFTAKIYLAILSSAIFIVLVLTIPSLQKNWLVFIICFGQSLTNIIFPQWYFQGIQRMRTVTYIQLAFKLISLIFIFIFIKKQDDIAIFTLIVTLTSLAGAMVAALIIRYKEGLKIYWSSLTDVKLQAKGALPFFGSNSIIVLKQQSAAVLLGAFFSMKDVALFDLAVKIYTVPTILIASINSALFPKVVVLKNITSTIKKIIKIENVIGVSIFILLVLFGKWIVMIMGGENMMESYNLLVILGVGIFAQLSVGAICNFIFIPQNKNSYILKDQIVAMIVFFAVAIAGILLKLGIFVIPLALTLSLLSELVYTSGIVVKYKMLRVG
ncbi:flippase [Paludibacter sp.]